jgi:hypothetical protein
MWLFCHLRPSLTPMKDLEKNIVRWLICELFASYIRMLSSEYCIYIYTWTRARTHTFMELQTQTLQTTTNFFSTTNPPKPLHFLRICVSNTQYKHQGTPQPSHWVECKDNVILKSSSFDFSSILFHSRQTTITVPIC